MPSIFREPIFWQALTAIIALAALGLSIKNYLFQKGLAEPRWRLSCTLDHLQRDGTRSSCLRLIFTNDGMIPLELQDLGLEVGREQLLKCKWPNNRTPLPITLDKGASAIATYYEDELPVIADHRNAKAAAAILLNGAVGRTQGRAIRRWRKLAKSRYFLT